MARRVRRQTGLRPAVLLTGKLQSQGVVLLIQGLKRRLQRRPLHGSIQRQPQVLIPVTGAGRIQGKEMLLNGQQG